MMTVSVIIPVWGRYVQWLGESVQSVLSQDVPTEVIVVANGGEELPLQPEGVRVLSVPKRLTVGACRNLGIAHAHGQLLCFQDADDIVLPGTFSLLTERMARRPDLVSAFCAMDHWYAETGRRRPFRWPSPQLLRHIDHHRLFAWWELEHNRIPMAGCSLHRADAVRHAGGFTEDDLVGQDWALAARLAWRGPMEYCDRVGRLYRHHPSAYRTATDLSVLQASARMVRRWVWRDPLLPWWVRMTWPVIWLRHEQHARARVRKLDRKVGR